MKVLLTGGSGFIAAHVLDQLLQNGHTVVTTVRSESKANKIKEAHPEAQKAGKLETVIVEDIAQENAFDQAIQSDPPFEGVLHTASPFHFNINDVEKDFLDPAIIGTTGILKSIKKYAPSVKRVVITSSFAAIVNGSKGLWPEHTYSEKDWSPLKREDAIQDPQANGYRASKTLAEKAAWDFVEKEKPNFSVSTINPPLVFGPVVHYLNSLDAINTSNASFRDAMQGKWKENFPATRMILWVDVRDVAAAHVAALEKPEAGGHRFFTTAGLYCNKEIVELISKNFPDLKDKLPTDAETLSTGELPKEHYGFDNEQSKKILGIEYGSFEKCVVDTVKSLQNVGA